MIDGSFGNGCWKLVVGRSEMGKMVVKSRYISSLHGAVWHDGTDHWWSDEFL